MRKPARRGRWRGLHGAVRVRYTAGFFAGRLGTIILAEPAGVDFWGNPHPDYLIVQVDGLSENIVSLGYKLELVEEAA